MADNIPSKKELKDLARQIKQGQESTTPAENQVKDKQKQMSFRKFVVIGFAHLRSVTVRFVIEKSNCFF